MLFLVAVVPAGIIGICLNHHLVISETLRDVCHAVLEHQYPVACFIGGYYKLSICAVGEGLCRIERIGAKLVKPNGKLLIDDSNPQSTRATKNNAQHSDSILVVNQIGTIILFSTSCMNDIEPVVH